MTDDVRVVVVGAGQAGLSVSAALRSEGFEGRVTLIGDEAVAPYHRPPLSKAFLCGSASDESLELRDSSFYVDNRIDLMLGSAVQQLDLSAGAVVLSDGSRVEFDSLVLATGATPRTLPSTMVDSRDGVVVLRSIEDARRLREEIGPNRSMAIVGGGYIGLEVAATAAEVGMSVTVLEAAPRILQRVACEETSAEIRRIHESHGVTILENVSLSELSGRDGVDAVRLSDGSTHAADVVVVAIGVVPNTGLAEAAGLAIDNGVAVDASMRTSEARVWAIGDCASIEFRGRRQRIESVGHATDSAHVAAAAILGKTAQYRPDPWFWSDQYDTRLKIAGHCDGYTHVHVRRSDDGVSHLYYRDHELLAVDSINDARSHAAARKLISAGRSPDPARVTDSSIDLRELVSLS